MTGGRAPRVHLLVYGWLAGLTRADLVYATGHAEPLPPVPLAVGVVEAAGRVILFDAGASPDWAQRKGVSGYLPATELLGRLGLAGDDVSDLVLSHLHWDHASLAPAYARARIHVQESEMDGWHEILAAGPDLRWVHEGRVERELLEALEGTGRLERSRGDVDIVPGVSCRLAPGHSFGTQFLEVVTESHGRIVLASDVVFTYENLERMIPLGNGLDQVAMLRSIARAREAAIGGLLVPGHDPGLLGRFEAIDERTFRIS